MDPGFLVPNALPFLGLLHHFPPAERSPFPALCVFFAQHPLSLDQGMLMLLSSLLSRRGQGVLHGCSVFLVRLSLCTVSK